MAKKKVSHGDPVSRRSLIEGIIESGERNFAHWSVSSTEESALKIAEGLEQIAEGLRKLVASGKLPAD